jgi:hypothetical protein
MNAHALRLRTQPVPDDDVPRQPRAPGRRTLTGQLTSERRQLIDRAVAAGSVGLPETLAHRLALAHGRPLGAFYLHTSPEANHAAQAMGARAFTVGRNIFFARGSYDPDSSQGQHVISREIEHATQPHEEASAAQEPHDGQ